MLTGDWTRSSPADRAALAPVLYLRSLGLTTTISHAGDAPSLDDVDCVLIAPRQCPDDTALQVARDAADRGKLVIVVPGDGDGVAETLRHFQGVRIDAVAAQGDVSGLPPAAGVTDVPLLRLPLVPARLAEDRLLRHAVGIDRPEDTAPADRSGARVACLFESPDALTAVAPALQRMTSGSEVEILAISSDTTGWDERMTAMGLRGRSLPLSAPGLLASLADAWILMIPPHDSAPDAVLPGRWARTALANGTAVIAASHPSLDPLADVCVLDDWDRGIALYADAQGRRRTVDAVIGRERVLLDAEPTKVADSCMRSISQLADQRVAVFGLAMRRREQHPTLLVQIDLGQDLDVLLPIIQANRERASLDLRVVVTHWLEKESPRVVERLRALGVPFETVQRKAARSGGGASLEGVDAVLTAAESTLSAHKAGRSLARRARAAGIPSFTLQHGFENVGISYLDEEHGADVVFESDVVFCWCSLAALPGWVRPETRDKLVPVGSPKPTPLPSATMTLPEADGWHRRIGVFENLHWHRYDEEYRERFVEDLVNTSRRVPDTLFLVKPHHAGRWLTKNQVLPSDVPNLLLIDPADERWHAFTAPVLINSLDGVITTPSTVALDAARAGRAVAVVGQELVLPIYEPLPILRGSSDWSAFARSLDNRDAALARNELFLSRALLPGCAVHRILHHIEQVIFDRDSRRQPDRSIRRDPAAASGYLSTTQPA